MNKAESKFFQRFKERTGKNASSLAAAGKGKAKKAKSATKLRHPRTNKSIVAELRTSLEILKKNYLDLREKCEAEALELKRQLFEEKEANKRLRKEIKSVVRGQL